MLIVFLGPPGAGKGTQAKILSHKLNIPHLSTGEILREMSNKDNGIGKILKTTMTNGLLVSDGIITELVKNRINMNDCKLGFILDGYPRTLNQAISLELILKEKNKTLDKVIQIDVPENILLKRITGRQVCQKCLQVYNKFFDPLPKTGCKYCGSKKKPIVRSDDEEKSFKNIRLKKYNDETRPLIDFYEKKELLKNFSGIDSSEKISKKIINYLKNI